MDVIRKAKEPSFRMKGQRAILSDGSLIIRHRATFPQCSILADAGLNFCVRDGNRCDPSSMGTDHNILTITIIAIAIILSSGSLDRINYICTNNLRQSQTHQSD